MFRQTVVLTLLHDRTAPDHGVQHADQHGAVHPTKVLFQPGLNLFPCSSGRPAASTVAMLLILSEGGLGLRAIVSTPAG